MNGDKDGKRISAFEISHVHDFLNGVFLGSLHSIFL